jgi:WD repeat-containing protein 48
MPRGQAGTGVKQSVYAMSMDAEANMLAIGTVESVIRILDARTGDKVMKLRGHTDNIR